MSSLSRQLEYEADGARMIGTYFADEVRSGRRPGILVAEDPLIPPAERSAFEAEMGRGGVDWQMHVYGGAQHSFTEPGIEARAAAAGFSGMKYSQSADRRSWRSMRQLFEEVFPHPQEAAPV